MIAVDFTSGIKQSCMTRNFYQTLNNRKNQKKTTTTSREKKILFNLCFLKREHKKWHLAHDNLKGILCLLLHRALHHFLIFLQWKESFSYMTLNANVFVMKLCCKCSLELSLEVYYFVRHQASKRAAAKKNSMATTCE